MKKNLLFLAMLWAFACLFCTSCNNKKDSLLVKGSPYVYEAEEPRAIITFEADGTFKFECIEAGWQDPDIYGTIQGKWDQRLTENYRSIIVLKYDLNTLSSEEEYKDLYGYFASENHLVEKHAKQKELYGFGPGYVGENYNFINDHGEVILYSITGNLDD